jgi:hypothetical protein
VQTTHHDTLLSGTANAQRHVERVRGARVLWPGSVEMEILRRQAETHTTSSTAEVMILSHDVSLQKEKRLAAEVML